MMSPLPARYVVDHDMRCLKKTVYPDNIARVQAIIDTHQAIIDLATDVLKMLAPGETTPE